MSETMQLLHPEGKKGARVQVDKYAQIKSLMLQVIEEKGTIAYKKLTEEMNTRLKGKFDGSITWYVTAVKLDLEARGVLGRYQQNNRQHIKLSK
ncbi:hypothetical protein GLW20_10370 [Virgibacillus halodenitrificans]|nr:hypothetical protein [Virgibacillus halodenitrificans]